MEYRALDDVPYYRECAPIVAGLGYRLVDLKVIPQKGNTHIAAVIASSSADIVVGVDDCAKVHRVLHARLEALLGTENTSMELNSPGINRTIKNAAEFTIFTGRTVRIWDRGVTDWVTGMISAADTASVTLELDGGDVQMFPYEQIAKAQLL